MRSYIIFIMLLPIIAWAKNQQVYYEPKIVELIGIVTILKFPGPPNYTSIQDGDADETGPYLVLHKPIDVGFDPKLQNDDNMPEKNVTLLQIVVKNKDNWNKIKEGHKVHVVGTLFHALTGHHHARVLIAINKINVLTNYSILNNNLQFSPEDQQFLEHEYLQTD